MDNPMQMIQMFNQFKNGYQGNPQEDIQRLLQSGRMTQQQLNELQREATQFQQLMSKFR